MQPGRGGVLSGRANEPVSGCSASSPGKRVGGVLLHRRRPSPWGRRRRRESAWGVLEVPRRHGRWWWRPRGVGEGRRWWGDGPRTILLLRGGIIRRRRRRWWWWWESWIEPVLKG